MKVSGPERSHIRRVQNTKDHCLSRKCTRDLPARRLFKMYSVHTHRCIAVAQWAARSHARMQAIQRTPSARAAQHDPTSGSQTVQAHSMRICELHCPPKAFAAHPIKSACQTAPRAAQDNTCCRWSHARSKRITALRSSPLGRLARRSSTRATPGFPRLLKRPPAAPSGSRSYIDCFESILTIVRRGDGRAR